MARKYAILHRTSLVDTLAGVAGGQGVSRGALRWVVGQTAAWCLAASKDRKVRFWPRVALGFAAAVLEREARRVTPADFNSGSEGHGDPSGTQQG